MQITIDTLHDTPEQMRIAASLLLTLSGDCPMEDTTPQTATGEQMDKLLSIPPVPAGTTERRGDPEIMIPPPPPPLVASPPAPLVLTPPPPAATAVPPSAPSTASAPAAVAATGAVSVEFDKAGMPWDGRIHQKGKSKKRDGTWKLKKGIDSTIVEAVTRELAAQRLPAAAATPATPAPAAGAVPPPPAAVASPVPLPPASNGAVPLPPQPSIPAAAELPASGVPAPVPVPPAPAPGGTVAPSPFKLLVDKLSAATNAGKITQQKVAEVVQSCGAPNLMQLNSMPHLIPEVSSRIDAVLAGLM